MMLALPYSPLCLVLFCVKLTPLNKVARQPLIQNPVHHIKGAYKSALIAALATTAALQ